MNHIYYMTQRPAMPGAMPRDGLVDIQQYDDRQYIQQIDCKAYAKLVYSRELADEEIHNYELVQEHYSVELNRAEISFIIRLFADIVHQYPDDIDRMEEIFTKLTNMIGGK